VKVPTTANLNAQDIKPIQQEKIDIDKWNVTEFEEEEEEEETDEVDGGDKKNAPNTSGSGGGFFSYLKSFTGVGKPLQEADLEPVLAKFKDHLIGKNVASEIAQKLCDSVKTSLEGKQLGTFSSLRSTVRGSMEESLVRILTPKRNIDILREVISAKREGRPYVITFCGVNGVGKSTNLAKVCIGGEKKNIDGVLFALCVCSQIASWLSQNGNSVMLTACDTFRAGAVEQLGVHAKRLGIDLFQRGYAKDPTAVAQEAIQCAKQQKKDVVLIDTAGRMQDNALLMQALSKVCVCVCVV
jgi:signal recognition particle receptor subunit alpha